MIAQVIVDVPTRQTDKTFDYLIPKKLEGIIKPGVRVVVPFGPRKVQGFVVSLSEESSFHQLKEIIEPMDLSPVLNRELLELGEWLTEKTLCFKISAFQVMLPPALKAKYEKKIKLGEQVEINDLEPSLQPFFKKQKLLSWKEGVELGLLPVIQKETSKGHLEVVYEVKERVKKKKVRYIVPNKDREELIRIYNEYPNRAKKQKETIKFFIDNEKPILYKQLLHSLNISPFIVNTLVDKGILKDYYEEVYRDPYENIIFEKKDPHSLTNDQKAAINPILASIEDKFHKVFLLYGVTGSGKTEIYLQSIQKVLEKGKEAICLVPEISLTPQMVKRFKERFGEEVAVLHSGLSAGEKYDEWRKIQRKEVKVVVGARSAIFAPFENLGIIIIDEEHETSYKQEDLPRYHARDVAIKRGEYHQCPVVLGSATPSLESFARAKKNVYELLTLPRRMNNHPLPSVKIIDMREEFRDGNRSMFSRDLLDAMKKRLERNEQIVLFLNKRGYSSFVMCRDCGYVILCPHCDLSMTYHRATEQMKCHYCGFESPVYKRCPECGSENIRYFGTGTQKVEEELGKILPEARVIRMDVDTTSRKGSHERLLNDFQGGKGDILLGTQMIAKGLDFPNVTLVGVLSADTMLHLPDFRSSEKTFQLLTQVSGRAGRHELEGEVIIQTYTPEHYSIVLAGEQNFDRFFEREMIVRKLRQYPPYYYLTLITVSHENEMKAASVTEKIAQFTRSKLSKKSIILGPVASPIPKINNRYRFQCLIKYKREENLQQTLKMIVKHYQEEVASSSLQISIDMNPYLLM